jgi:hypothetical protein
MLRIWSWPAIAIIPFVDAIEPGLVPFSVGPYGLESALRIIGFVVALESGLAIVVALACWLALELAGILAEDRKPSVSANRASTCANQYFSSDEFDFRAGTWL